MSEIVPAGGGSLSSRENFLASIGNLQPEDAFPTEWSPEDKAIGALELTSKPVGSDMYSKIPRLCKGEKCADYTHKRCKLPKRPEGDRCPYEVRILEALLNEYVGSLNVDANDITTFSIIRDLVDTEIQLIRLQGKFSENPEFTIEQDMYDQEGNVVSTMVVENPVVNSVDKHVKRKAVLFKQLAATREAKLKLIGDTANRSEISRVASIMSRVARALESGKQIDKIQDDEEYRDPFIDGEVIEVEAEIIDPEE